MAVLKKEERRKGAIKFVNKSKNLEGAVSYRITTKIVLCVNENS